MAAGIEFFTQVVNGRMGERARAGMLDLFKKLEGKKIKIRVTRVQKKRSLQQNAYYWGVVLPLVLQMFQDAGNETNAEEVHEYLKKYVWGWTRNLHTPDGVVDIIANSSAQLSTVEWEEMMLKTRAWAGRFGYVIPEPNEGAFDEERDNEEETERAPGARGRNDGTPRGQA